jgi:hypothetical protein
MDSFLSQGADDNAFSDGVGRDTVQVPYGEARLLCVLMLEYGVIVYIMLGIFPQIPQFVQCFTFAVFACCLKNTSKVRYQVLPVLVGYSLQATTVYCTWY